MIFGLKITYTLLRSAARLSLAQSEMSTRFAQGSFSQGHGHGTDYLVSGLEPTIKRASVGIPTDSVEKVGRGFYGRKVRA